MARILVIAAIATILLTQGGLIVLRLAGAIDWPWTAVFAPVLAAWAAGTVLGLAAVACALWERAAARLHELVPPALPLGGGKR
jgi:hypothetical protein